VKEQGDNATKLLSALHKFSTNEDFQGFSLIEAEFNSMSEKLKQIQANPSAFSREFDEEDWEDN
jgi:hypothetical protein